MNELCSIHAHENGYSVQLRHPPKKEKADSKGRFNPTTPYAEPESHVAETHEKALDIARGHLEKHSSKSNKQAKTDKLADAARAGYRRIGKATSMDAGEDTSETGHDKPAPGSGGVGKNRS